MWYLQTAYAPKLKIGVPLRALLQKMETEVPREQDIGFTRHRVIVAEIEPSAHDPPPLLTPRR